LYATIVLEGEDARSLQADFAIFPFYALPLLAHLSSPVSNRSAFSGATRGHSLPRHHRGRDNPWCWRTRLSPPSFWGGHLSNRQSGLQLGWLLSLEILLTYREKPKEVLFR